MTGGSFATYNIEEQSQQDDQRMIDDLSFKCGLSSKFLLGVCFPQIGATLDCTISLAGAKYEPCRTHLQKHLRSAECKRFLINQPCLMNFSSHYLSCQSRVAFVRQVILAFCLEHLCLE